MQGSTDQLPITHDLQMTGLLREVQATRSALQRIEQARAMLLAMASAVVTALLVPAIMDVPGRMMAAQVSVSRNAIMLVAALMVAGIVWQILRPKEPVSLRSAALWIEEQAGGQPSFALVTLIEKWENTRDRAAGVSDAPIGNALVVAAEEIARAGNHNEAIRELRLARCRPPFVFLLIAGMLLLNATLGLTRDVTIPSLKEITGLSGNERSFSQAAALGELSVRVTPPPYSGRDIQVSNGTSPIRALHGSAIEISGDGAVPEVTNRIAGSSESIARRRIAGAIEGGRWIVRLHADSVPHVLEIGRAGDRRLVIIEGFRDSIPVVVLETPERDSVYREPSGVIPLKAAVSDDIGLSSGSFEVLVSSGEGERFTLRSLEVGRTNWARVGQRAAARAVRGSELSASIDLATLKLQAGDVLHIRAVARDWNPRPDREAGSSETRSIRIAREGEYDSVAVEPIPPPDIDRSLVSQRMLLMLTEKLDGRKQQLGRPLLLRESRKLAVDQTRLRRAVGDIVFQRLSGDPQGEHSHSLDDGHDHGIEDVGGRLALSASAGVLDEGDDAPVIGINKPLLEAYNFMWDAGRALEQGETHKAIPAMRLALDAIERSNAMSRIYLRGRPPQVIVDIAKVRLSARDTGITSTRPPRTALSSIEMLWDRRLVGAVTRLGSSAVNRDVTAAVRDTIAIIRAEALAVAPAFAASLESLLAKLESGGDLTSAIVNSRRTLGTVRRANGSRWSKVLPP